MIDICNLDCFNCPYSDCIREDFSDEELENLERLINILTEPEGQKSKKDRHDYYVRNQEKLKAYGRKYYAEHKEQHAAWRKSYYEANRERILAKQREYHRKNRDRIAIAARNRYFAKLAQKKAQNN